MDSNRPTRWTGIECPKCGCSRLDVYYTRHRGGCLIRVRTCALCGKRVPTVEAVVGRSESLPEPPREKAEYRQYLDENAEETAPQPPKAAKIGKKVPRAERASVDTKADVGDDGGKGKPRHVRRRAKHH